MAGLFKKKGEKKTLGESERLELSRKAYELGFEVGYHKHSELGWVVDSYSKMETFARKYDLLNLVNGYYAKGKEDGLQSKKRDMNVALSKRDIENEKEESVSAFQLPRAEIKVDFESGFSSSHGASGRTYAPIEEPTMIVPPKMTSMIGSIKIPEQIKGFEPLVPKR